MNEAAVAQVVEWTNAVCTTYRLGGWAQARELLAQLTREHGFDDMGMEAAMDYPGVDGSVVFDILVELRHPSRTRPLRHMPH